jgi:carbamoyl-phosphate synthase large subunit
VLNIYDQEQPEGVFVQFGGQTPLNLASGLKRQASLFLGRNPKASRPRKTEKLFAAMLDKLGLAPNAQRIGHKLPKRPWR